MSVDKQMRSAHILLWPCILKQWKMIERMIDCCGWICLASLQLCLEILVVEVIVVLNSTVGAFFVWLPSQGLSKKLACGLFALEL